MKRIYLPILFVSVLTACSQPDSSQPNASESQTADEMTAGHGQEAVSDAESTPNILQVALGSPNHTTLVAAVKASEQTTALANNGPLTVFAPTNSAFDALPEGTLESLLKPENKSTLVSIVQFHAAPGTYDIDQLKDGQSLFVASGGNLKVENREDGTYVQGAKIIGTVKAANGIVHVVDKVLLPE